MEIVQKKQINIYALSDIRSVYRTFRRVMLRGKNRFYFLLFNFAFCFTTAFAQTGKGVSVEGTFHYGKIFKHHSFLRYEVPPQSLGADLNFVFQTYGNQPWHELHNYPVLGLTLLYYHFGDKEVLGYAVGLCPNLTIYLAKSGKFSIDGQIGAGPSYLSKPFNRLENPNNNAIGSHLNFNFYFRFSARWQLDPQWNIGTGISFTHYSNGAAKFPNFGINIPSLSLGARFTPKPLEPTDFISHGTPGKPDKRFGINITAGAGTKEISVIGGPSYPIYSFAVSGLYYLSKTNRLSLGLEHEINRSVYTFGRHLLVFRTEAEARRGSNRNMLFVADEFLFGPIGLRVQLGVYLHYYPELTPFPLYNKWGFYYHFPKILNSGIRPYLGTNIKTHLYVADYISLDLGVNF